MQIDVIGVPLDLGSKRIGVDMGPNALRLQNFIQNLTNVGLVINDLGNMLIPSSEELDRGENTIKYLDPIARTCQQLSSNVEQAILAKHKVLILGGDHSIAIGSVSGASNALKGEMGIIWIDAHGDLNTQETTPSGNIHGMPLATLLGAGHERLTSIAKSPPAITFENTIIIGCKDLDAPERRFIKTNSIQAFSISDIVSDGLRPVINAIEALSKKVSSIWVSFDLDAVDMTEAPGVGMPNKGGLTYREIHAVAECIGASCNVVGVDLVEYNPVNDIEHKTATLSTEITSKLYGKEFSRYSTYLKEHSV